MIFVAEKKKKNKKDSKQTWHFAPPRFENNITILNMYFYCLHEEWQEGKREGKKPQKVTKCHCYLAIAFNMKKLSDSNTQLRMQS